MPESAKNINGQSNLEQGTDIASSVGSCTAINTVGLTAMEGMIDVSELLSVWLSMNRYKELFANTVKFLKDEGVADCDLPYADDITQLVYDNLTKVLKTFSSLASEKNTTVLELLENIIKAKRPSGYSYDPAAIWGSKTRDLFTLWLRLKRVAGTSNGDEYAAVTRILRYYGIEEESLPNSTQVNSDVLKNLERIWISLERFRYDSRDELVSNIEGTLGDAKYTGSNIGEFIKFVSPTGSSAGKTLTYMSYSYNGTLTNATGSVSVASTVDENLASQNKIQYNKTTGGISKDENPTGGDGGAGVSQLSSDDANAAGDQCKSVVCNTHASKRRVNVERVKQRKTKVTCVSGCQQESVNIHGNDDKKTEKHSKVVEEVSATKSSNSVISLDEAVERELENFCSSSINQQNVIPTTAGYKRSTSASTGCIATATGSTSCMEDKHSELRKESSNGVDTGRSRQRKGSHFSQISGHSEVGTEFGEKECYDDGKVNIVGQQSVAYSKAPSSIGEKESCSPAPSLQQPIQRIPDPEKNKYLLSRTKICGALGSCGSREESNAHEMIPVQLAGPSGREDLRLKEEFSNNISIERQQSDVDDCIVSMVTPPEQTSHTDRQRRAEVKGRRDVKRSGFSSCLRKKEISTIVAMFCAVFLFILAMVTSVGVSTPLSSLIVSPTALIFTFTFLLSMSGICTAIALCCASPSGYDLAKSNGIRGRAHCDKELQVVSNPAANVAAVCPNEEYVGVGCSSCNSLEVPHCSGDPAGVSPAEYMDGIVLMPMPQVLQV